MKILISGAGIGGLALAAFLRESDIECEIVEKCESWEHQGYLIGMWNNGRRILGKLRLAEKLDAEADRVRFYSIRDGKGRILRNYNLHEFYSNFGVALMLLPRAKLHEWLLSLVDTSQIRMGVTIERIEERSDSVTVTFSDGSAGVYTGVIGADGINSRVRELVFDKHIESYTGWRAWYAWIENRFNTPSTIVEYIEPKEFVIVMGCKGKTLAMFVAPADHKIWDKTEGRMEMLKCTFKDECLLVPEILQKLREGEIVPTDLADVRMRTWVSGRVALIGDAAHSFGAMAGFGASMALEDAYVLAGELMKIPRAETVPSALREYERRRKSRVENAQHLGERMRSWALVESPKKRAFINFLMPIIPERYFTADYFSLLREEI